MVRAEPIWHSVLAGYNVVPWSEVFPPTDSRGGLHGDHIRTGGIFAELVTISLSIDASELKQDLERIENGELELPTVSAVQICCDGIFKESVLIWIQE